MQSFKPIIYALTGVFAFSLSAATLQAKGTPAQGAQRLAVIKVEGAPVVEVNGASLAEAAAKGRTTTVQNLLAQGVSPDSRDANGTPAIVLAAKSGFADTVQALAKGNAQVNATANDGATALILAANGGHTKTVSALLEVGANANAKRKDGESALSLATKNKFDEIVQSAASRWRQVTDERNENASCKYLQGRFLLDGESQ